MRVKYFGTSLTEKGHYLKDLLSLGLDYNYSISTSHFPFDIYSFTKGNPKGFVAKEIVGKYKVIAIEGSCSDTRWGTVSVFITEENVSLKEFELYLSNHPWVIKMLEQMPFEVNLNK